MKSMIPIRAPAPPLWAAAALLSALALQALAPAAEPYCVVGSDRCPTVQITKLYWWVDLEPAQLHEPDLLPAGHPVESALLPFTALGCEATEVEFEIPASFLATLTPGFHHLYVRGEDDTDPPDNHGSFIATIFEVPAPVQPTADAKLFIDREETTLDPAADPGTSFSLTYMDIHPDPDETILEAQFDLDVSALPPGSHWLHLSLLDATGFWTVPLETSFLVDVPNGLCPPSLLTAAFPDPSTDPVDIAFAPAAEGCFEGYECFEATIKASDFPSGKGYLDLCMNQGDAEGLWVDLQDGKRFWGAINLVEPETYITVSPTIPEQVLRIRVPPGATVVIDLGDDILTHLNTLLARFGAAPTDSEFDKAFLPGEGSGGRLVITSTSTVEEDLFILVRGEDFSGDRYEVELTAAIVYDALILEGMTPTSGATCDGCSVSATVRGTHLDRATGFLLRLGGTTANASSVILVAEDRAEMIFDLSGKPLGRYDLVAKEGATESTLPRAFEAVAPVKGPLLEATLGGLDVGRLEKPGRIYLRYKNIGDVEMDAPLFLVRASAGVTLRLEGDAAAGTSEIAVIGAGSGAAAGRLPPEEGGEVPIVFVSNDPALPTAVFEAFVLRAPPWSYVGWDARPEPTGMTEAAWKEAYPALSVRLGATWAEYAVSLSEIATRLARRGVDPASAFEAFRFAAREALGRPTAAVLGTLETPAGAPIAGAQVIAFDGDTVVSSATTNSLGVFAVDCLTSGKTYTLRAKDYDLAVSAPVPAEGSSDLFLPGLVTSPSPNGLVPAPACDSSGLPAGVLAMPDRYLEKVAAWKVEIMAAFDPNGKVGTNGSGGLEPGEPSGLRADSVITYTINFQSENGSDPVRKVEVVDDLPAELDPSKIVIQDAVIAGQPCSLRDTKPFQASQAISLDGPHTFHVGVLPVVGRGCQPVEGFLPVVITVEKPDERKIRWTIEAEGFAECIGMLDDAPYAKGDSRNADHEGSQGSVSFSIPILASAVAGQGDVDIFNRAIVYFDGRPEPWAECHLTLKAGVAPSVPKNPVPRDGSTDLLGRGLVLGWQAPGATSYKLYVWKYEGDPPAARPAAGDPSYVRAGNELPDPAHRFSTEIQPGTKYAWQVEATNSAGTTVGPIWTFATLGAVICPSTFGGSSSQLTGSGVVLGWDAVSGANSYDVYLGREGESLALVASGFEGTELTLKTDLEIGVTYLWQVSARNGNTTDCGTESMPGTHSPVWRIGLKLFQRGDANGDKTLDLTDAIFTLQFLFMGGKAPACKASADTDDSGELDLTDAISSLQFQFMGGKPPAPPTTCGSDPTADSLGCETSTCP